MIFVTVGTHHQGFNRLVQAMDTLASYTAERVVIQRGSSTYHPQHAEGFAFASGEHVAQLTDEARVVVAHAAAGAAMLAIAADKPLVLAPRLRRFDEHLDDHQVQLAQALSERGRAVAAYELSADALSAAIGRAVECRAALDGPERLIGAVRSQLDRWTSPGLPFRDRALRS